MANKIKGIKVEIGGDTAGVACRTRTVNEKLLQVIILKTINKIIL